MAGRLAHASHRQQPVLVYVTSDGGKTWKARLVSSSVATASYPQGSFSVPFSASGPSDWVMLAGSTEYSTHDGGAHWTGRAASLPADMRIDSIRFISAALGWAQATGPEWTYLLRTTNSGRNWTTVSM
jgi:photosystem II stability/assembly factor-like uncharacterized protein